VLCVCTFPICVILSVSIEKLECVMCLYFPLTVEACLFQELLVLSVPSVEVS